MTVRRFDPPPAPGELPSRLPSPFDVEAIPAIARRAAARLMAELGDYGEGKMFGVLVVRDASGRIGWTCGFSGMLRGAWDVAGFVPPAFDPAMKGEVWPAGEVELAAMEARRAALLEDPPAAGARAALAAREAQARELREALVARHAAARGVRRAARAALGPPPLDEAGRAALHALDQQSRADAAEKKRSVGREASELASLRHRVAELDTARATIAAARTARSRVLLHAIYDSYRLANARGERRALRALFAPAEPPGGAGDCAAPKLLAHAYAHGLTPIAIAEFWWGAPPVTGGRTHGVYYPACRGKCGPILAHMLEGLDAGAPPAYGAAPVAAAEPRTVFEDDWIVVVEKPVGLLSVPGRSGQLRDSVQTRLRTRYPHATGPLVVHRLDLDTSGLLLAAKDLATYITLQADFARREVEKRYDAWLDGEVAGDAGRIELPLRVDVDDRPRQIVDPQHGKAALTEWRVVARESDRTRVELTPRTGRTHQLRVHCAHPRGLGAAIVGDRLYGRPAARLLLHAAVLAFPHPHLGTPVAFRSNPPWT